ncbi:MAG: hypothetical protein ACKVJU_23430 [Verrucomicrobiales bacterium]
MDEATKQRILDGDLDAFAKIVGKYQNMVKGYALRRLGNWRSTTNAIGQMLCRRVLKNSKRSLLNW